MSDIDKQPAQQPAAGGRGIVQCDAYVIKAPQADPTPEHTAQEDGAPADQGA